MNFKTLFRSVVLGAVFGAVSGMANAVEWDMPTPYPANNFHTENIMAFAKEVEDKSAGKLVIKVHPGGALFKHPEIKRAVQLGQAQIGEVLLSLLANEDPFFAADTIPFLASSPDQAKRLWEASRKTLDDKFGAKGLTVLYSAPWPSQGIYANKELNTLKDLSGLKFRVQGPVFSRFAELVGAQPVSVAYSDLIQGLSTNLVNSMMSSATAGPDLKIWEHLKYFYDVSASRPRNIVLVNTKAFEALDSSIQKIVREAAEAAQMRGWERVASLEKEFVAQLSEQGMTVSPGSDELLSGLRQVGQTMIDEWSATAGEEGAALAKEMLK